jgi:hypothetical protein
LSCFDFLSLFVGTQDIVISSIDRPIAATNVGFKLLSKMGWKGSGGLGRDGRGIAEPIKHDTSGGTLGLGKQSEYEELVRLSPFLLLKC